MLYFLAAITLAKGRPLRIVRLGPSNSGLCLRFCVVSLAAIFGLSGFPSQAWLDAASGHYYEAIPGGFTWGAAKTAAEQFLTGLAGICWTKGKAERDKETVVLRRRRYGVS